MFGKIAMYLVGMYLSALLIWKKKKDCVLHEIKFMLQYTNMGNKLFAFKGGCTSGASEGRYAAEKNGRNKKHTISPPLKE